MSLLVFNSIPGSAVQNPLTGKVRIFADSADNNKVKQKDSNGTVRVLASPAGLSATVAASAAINTTETIVAGGTAAPLDVGSLLIGSTFRIILNGTCTASAANVSTFRVRVGAAGTTSDAQVASFTVTSATTGTAIPFRVEIIFTVRTVGATGTLYGSAVVMNQGTTGLSALTLNVVALTNAAINTTTAAYISATYQAAATTTTSTFQNGIIEIIKT